MNPNNRKYGLILSKQSKETGQLKPRLSAFSNEDSSDDDGKGRVNSQIHKEAIKKIMKKQTKLEIQKALEEDATVYEYDNIYDDMKAKSVKKTTPTAITKADKLKKPKYIGSLMKAAEVRQRERQRVEERKIEKERQKEGDEFKDKPEFVTSAYRKRMQERQEEEEREKREAAIEDALDVRKQKDLSGFYRHFLRQQMGEEPTPEQRVSEAEKPPMKESHEQDKPDSQNDDEDDRDTDLSFSSSDSEEEKEITKPSHNELLNEEMPPDKLMDVDHSDVKHKLSEERTQTENNNGPPNKQIKEDENASSAFIKRTNQDSALSARERYLARKKMAKKAPVENS